MQDRRRQFDEIFLQRTAGPYIRVKLRKTQREHISSALLPRTDIGLANLKHCSDPSYVCEPSTPFRRSIVMECLRFGSDEFASFVVTILRTTAFSPSSNCQMFATLRTNFSCVTIAPHENQN
jgi:hypothetical protein